MRNNINSKNEAKIINNRIEWIVNLRAFACVAVVVLHVVEFWSLNKTQKVIISSGRQFLDLVIIPTLTRYAVPCFIMISGCLLLHPKHNVNIEKIKRYVFKMLWILCIFGFAFCMIENIFNFGMSNIVKLLIKSVFDLLQAKSWGHMWYLYMLIGLYIITPILRKFIEHSDIATAKFTLLSLFILSVVIPTINTVFEIKITTFYLSSFYYIFLYLMGYYLVYIDIIKDKYIYLGGVIGIIGYTILSYFNRSFSSSVFIVLEAILVFKLFSSGKINIKSNKLIEVISKYSLGIFIIHPFWINLMYKGLGIFPDILPTMIGEIVFFVVIFTLSIITSIILYKMPITRKMWKI